MDPVGITLLATLLTGGAAMLWHKRAARRRCRQALVAAVQQRDADIGQASSPLQLPPVTFAYGPATVRVSGTVEGRFVGLVVSAQLRAGELPRFVLAPRTSLGRGAHLGSANPRFENQFVVDAEQPEQTRALWTSRALELMVRIGNPALSGEGLLPAVDGTLRSTGRVLRFDRRIAFKRASSYEMLFQLIEELIDAATWHERSRPTPMS